MQFGDDIVGGAVDDVRAALERKKLWKREHRLNRLHEDRMMPLGHRFEDHRDPEEEATAAYDHPPPPPGPPPDHRPARERERRPQPEEAEGGYDTAEEGVPQQPSSSILTSLSSGANSTLADMGAGLVHGTAYLAGAAAGAVGKGLVRGITHLATGSSSIEDGGHEAASEAEEPLKPYPKAKAGKSMSSGSWEKPMPWPAPARPWVDDSSYNGRGAHAFFIGDSEDDRSPPRPAAAAAAAPAAPARRSRLAQRDVDEAERIQRELPPNDWGRGRRRAPGRGG